MLEYLPPKKLFRPPDLRTFLESLLADLPGKASPTAKESKEKLGIGSPITSGTCKSRANLISPPRIVPCDVP